MASIANNFSLEELGEFLKTLDKETFASLFQQTLQVIRATSATGIYQTAMNFDSAIYKRLENLKRHILTNSTNWVRQRTTWEKKKRSVLQKKINAPNRVLGIPDFSPMDMKIIEEPKYQSPVVSPMTQTKLNVQAKPYTPRRKKRVTYTDIVSGFGSDDFWPTSPFSEEKRNTQQTSKKGSTNNKSQQQTTKSLSLY
ncbi:unnamed protein product [Rhizophagus irregularis]|nr:unnamed protein product [Rhizophagus irregularis]